MSYELWSRASSNLIGAWVSKAELKAAIRRGVESNGIAWLEQVGGVYEPDDPENPGSLELDLQVLLWEAD